MPIIFRFNVPFTNRYLLITSKCSRHKVELSLIDCVREWHEKNNLKLHNFPFHNLGMNKLGVDNTDSLLPLYLVRNMSTICPDVTNAKVMSREVF